MHPNDYEALTVAELKEMADQLGLEIPHDARKADIIEDLRRAVQKEAVSEEPPLSAEQQNVYTYQTSSTTDGLMSQEDFWKIKLTS